MASYSARPRIWPIACFLLARWFPDCGFFHAAVAELRPYVLTTEITWSAKLRIFTGWPFVGESLQALVQAVRGGSCTGMRTPGSLRHPPCCASCLSWWGRVTSVPALSLTALGPPPPSQWPDLTACPLICKVGWEDRLGWLGRFQKIRSVQRRLVEGYYHGHHTLSCHRGYGGTGVTGGGCECVCTLGEVALGSHLILVKAIEPSR